MLRKMVLELDEEDFDVIQAEIAHRQARSRWPDGGVILPIDDESPDEVSNLAGMLIAEMIRDLDEYRAMFDAERRGRS